MELGTGRRRRSSEPGPAGGADYLSALPEDLLLLVLARLGCAAAAARTGLLSRRWRGLWARLRDLSFRNRTFPSLQAALGRVSRSPPEVSLLEIRARSQNWAEGEPAAGAVTSLLRAAARLAPEKLVFSLQCQPDPNDEGVDLPCFHRATSIVLEWMNPFVLRAPAAGGDLGAFISLCPHLRVLGLKGMWVYEGDEDDDSTKVHSASLQELVIEDFVAKQVSIVAPILKQLTVSLRAEGQVSISILAPMIENVSWQWLYGPGIIAFGLWIVVMLSLQTADTQGQLTSLHIHAQTWFFLSNEEDNFAQEIEKHMVVDFSALELHLTTKGHVIGAFVSHLLGFNRIRSVIQRLKVALLRFEERGVCSANCSCQPTNWRTQIIPLTALEEVEIDGFEGEDHELDFLKLVFSCAPMLKEVIVKLSGEVSSSDDRCTKIYDIFREYSSVKCNLYLSSGLMHHSQNCLQA
ncbi:hypothetical protein VPH35_139772 [Triticum aestivum]